MKKILTPVLLRGFGRSGTTLMMQLLGTSGRIFFDREYPYENRLLTYFYRWSKLPAKKMGRESNIPWDNNSLIYKDLAYMSGFPRDTGLLQNKERFTDQLFHAVWREFSAEVLTKADHEACYYAEKSPMDLAPNINKLMFTKNIFLFRDPRDEMVSIKRFNEKRGTLGFGWLPNDDDISFANKFVRQRKSYMRHLIESPEESTRTINIFYEELVADLEKASNRLSNWLGVVLDHIQIEKQLQNHLHHMTSESVAASVKKWKTELSEEVLAIFNKELGEELQQLGYEL